MTIDEHEIATILTFEEESSSGESCKFIDLENGWGIKCFFCIEDCDVSYLCQKEAAKYNLAPNVGKKFNLIDHDGNGWYCHMTEVAETLCGYGYENAHAEYCKDAADLYRDERDEYIDELHDATGQLYRDDHVGNFGFIIRNGASKLVAIDFNLCNCWYRDLVKT